MTRRFSLLLMCCSWNSGGNSLVRLGKRRTKQVERVIVAQKCEERQSGIEGIGNNEEWLLQFLAVHSRENDKKEHTKQELKRECSVQWMQNAILQLMRMHLAWEKCFVMLQSKDSLCRRRKIHFIWQSTVELVWASLHYSRYERTVASIGLFGWMANITT